MTFYESSWCYDVPLKSGGEEGSGGSGVGEEELRSGEGVRGGEEPKKCKEGSGEEGGEKVW